MHRAIWERLVVLAVLGAVSAGGCGPTGGASSPTLTEGSPPSSSVTPTTTQSPTASPPASTPSPSAAASVPTEWTTYTSKRYAYSIDYPSDWTATPAAQDWPGDASAYPEDNAIDKWAIPPTSPWVLMFVSSTKDPAGKTTKDRFARLDDDNALYCSLGGASKVKVDGVDGRRQAGKCFGTDFIDEVAVGHDGRFYLIYVLSATPFSEATKGTFEHFLGSFRFAGS